MSQGADSRAQVEGLREELAAVKAREAELRRLLLEAHDELARRDEEVVQAVVWRARLAAERVEQMRATKVWRAASTYWRLRDRLLGRRPWRDRPSPS